MRSADSRHLTPDEIVERVFPGDDRPTVVPAHLASCGECQGRVARLRMAWLLDRGAVAGVVEALPESFWNAQAASVMRAIAADASAAAPGPAGVDSFPLRARRFLWARRPVVVFGSLAAGLLLVLGITVSRRPAPHPVALNHPTPAAVAAASDKADDELLRDIDHVISEDAPVMVLLSEETL